MLLALEVDAELDPVARGHGHHGWRHRHGGGRAGRRHAYLRVPPRMTCRREHAGLSPADRRGEPRGIDAHDLRVAAGPLDGDIERLFVLV